MFLDVTGVYHSTISAVGTKEKIISKRTSEKVFSSLKY
jgi:hypothetical protein